MLYLGTPLVTLETLRRLLRSGAGAMYEIPMHAGTSAKMESGARTSTRRAAHPCPNGLDPGTRWGGKRVLSCFPEVRRHADDSDLMNCDVDETFHPVLRHALIKGRGRRRLHTLLHYTYLLLSRCFVLSVVRLYFYYCLVDETRTCTNY